MSQNNPNSSFCGLPSNHRTKFSARPTAVFHSPPTLRIDEPKAAKRLLIC